MPRVNEPLNIKGAKIIFRNFGGDKDQYDRDGKRTFALKFVDHEEAQAIMDLGWNLRIRQPKNEEQDPYYYLKVGIRFDFFPPNVYIVTKNNKTRLTEDTIGLLDEAEIVKADVVIRPYNWVMNEGTKNEKRGCKAYLKAAYITIEQDAFADDYDDIPLTGDGHLPF